MSENNKQFTINIKSNDKEFSFSGPNGTSYSELETISLKLLSEFIILNWKSRITLEAKSKAESKDNDEVIDKVTNVKDSDKNKV